MKNKLFLCAALAALFLTGCETKKVADADSVKLSFRYREVKSDGMLSKVEIESTSTPSYIADDLWYKFDGDYAMMIGNGARNFYITDDTVNVSVWYKPGVAPEQDAIRAAGDFIMEITGVADSTWRDAQPIAK